MSADPDPVDSFLNLGSQCPVMIADAHGPKNIDAFKVQGRVTRIGFEKGKVLVSQGPDFGRQRVVQGPELRGGQVPQSSRAFPAL